MDGKFWIGAMAGLAAFGVSASFADNAPTADLFSRLSVDDAVVLAVRTDFAAPGGQVRLTVYDDPRTFLDAPAARHHAVVNDDGLAVVTLRNLEAGDYAFVAYFDKNKDGKLNRNAIGKPKEPYVFSNDIHPKLRKPTFKETSVSVAPGEVVVMTLED